ncbi:MAG: class I adenylate-forming enzyme family protein [Gammaproteobacteria bacterium]
MTSTLVENLRASALRRPHAEAVVHGTRRLTYAALWAEVEAVAGLLRANGMVPQTRVAVLLENSPDYIAAYYGVLAAGGVVVALNTAAKAAELTHWLAHSEAQWLFASAAHPQAAELQTWCRGRVRVVMRDAGHGDALAWPSPLSDVTMAASSSHASPRDALAAIIYTSGTTGRPKGVMLSHGNLAANVDSILAYLGLNERDRSVVVLPFYYSYGNSVLHTHLAAGACLVLEERMIYPHHVAARMAAERATGFAGVPSTFALLLSRVRLADYDLSCLRYLTQAGGPMAPALQQRLRAALPQARLYVMYGQTEATARLSYLPPERLDDKAGSVGIAIPGVTLEVRDERGVPVAAHEAGEIWARGPNIMLGYWRDAAATAEVLVDGWLNTGDLGYRDDDGFIFLQGRKTDMIKSGAHRIHPKEIEEAIAELDGVAEVAVVGVADEILGQSIKAVIVPRADVALDAMRVKAHCQQRLASYKMPRYVEFAPQLPRTASGKVQRYRLVSGEI